MSTYQQFVSFMLMFETELPSEMLIEAVALWTWKLYMGQLAIKIEKGVIKTFEKTDAVTGDTNKTKP
eukprot:11070634-Ditylum_brightwellii.AAC.2